MLKRLTVHLENVKPERIKTGKRDPKTNTEVVKVILNNTISVHNLTSQAEINQALSDIRKDHTIAKCPDNKRNRWKFGKDMWYTSNETL